MKVRFFIIVMILLISFSKVNATVRDVVVAGSDAIWLAGRSDLVIPPADSSWESGLVRHGSDTPEEIQETLPPEFPVAGGDIIKVLDPVNGGISFFNGFGGTVYGPEGNGTSSSSNITSFGGISGYLGTQGALVGLFLDDNIPNGVAPSVLDFSIGGLSTDFNTLMPALGQVFFIGDGVTSGNVFQEFIAPGGATRFFVGVVDAFSFNGAPGAFDDNDGSYHIRLGINEDPTNECTTSEPASVASNLDIHVPSAVYQSSGGTSNIWFDLEFKGVDSDGDYIWKLKDVGSNQ